MTTKFTERRKQYSSLSYYFFLVYRLIAGLALFFASIYASTCIKKFDLDFQISMLHTDLMLSSLCVMIGCFMLVWYNVLSSDSFLKLLKLVLIPFQKSVDYFLFRKTK